MSTLGPDDRQLIPLVVDDLDECADCGESTAIGTPDPHVCGEASPSPIVPAALSHMIAIQAGLGSDRLSPAQYTTSEWREIIEQIAALSIPDAIAAVRSGRFERRHQYALNRRELTLAIIALGYWSSDSNDAPDDEVSALRVRLLNMLEPTP